MNNVFSRLALVMGLLAVGGTFAQVPTAAPAGSTGLCTDGSYTTHATKSGACSGHKGVKEWFATAATAAPIAAASAPVPTPAVKVDAPVVKTATAASAAPVSQAPGGGAGQVWVNPSSKAYHCFGTKYYGKTKQGEYMTEAAAKAAGNHSADHGKSCGG